MLAGFKTKIRYMRKLVVSKVSNKSVGITEGAAFLQEAVMLMGSQLDLSLTDSQQVIENEVTVVNFEPQDVVLLSLEVGELLLPPGVDVVVANGCFPQTG